MLGTKEISEILKVKPVTVRKYAAALEKAGYIVQRDDNGNRVYTQNDATAFRELQALCERSGMTVENSAEVITARTLRATQAESSAVVPTNGQAVMQYDPRYDELINTINNLVNQNSKILEQNERMAERMAEQNANLTQIMREVTETKRMIAEKQRKSWKFWERNKQPTDPQSDPELAWKKREKRIY
ncbi:MerR family transcriptional regulator [Paenibacillus oralis]|nr:MerR family transcriptional regulator [Paenibacillus oralis]